MFGGTQLGGASFGLLQVIPIASGGFQTVALQVNPQLGTLIPNSNGVGTEFTFTFNRTLLTPIAIHQPLAHVDADGRAHGLSDAPDRHLIAVGDQSLFDRCPE